MTNNEAKEFLMSFKNDNNWGDGIKEAFSMAIKALEKQKYNGWIPVEEKLPDTDDYILLSFSNFSIPLVGRYESDKDRSGAFYIGDELETCLSQDLFVNAWKPLPEPYKESEKE